MDELAEYLERNIGALGGELELDYSNTQDQRGEICRVNVPTHLARGWMLSFGTGSFYGDGALLVSTDPLTSYAEVKWGIGSGLVTAQIDWRQGQVLSFFGTTVIVTAVLPSQGALPAALPGYPARFDASLCPGERQPTFPATRTVFYQMPAGPAEVTLPIPKFARQFIVAVDPIDALFEFIFYRGDGSVPIGARGSYAGPATRTNRDIGLPVVIPAEATWVRIVSTTSGILTVRLIYELAF